MTPWDTAPATSAGSAPRRAIEVVTDGILTRRLQRDPALAGHRPGHRRRGPRAEPPGRPRAGVHPRRALGHPSRPPRAGDVGDARHRAGRSVARRGPKFGPRGHERRPHPSGRHPMATPGSATAVGGGRSSPSFTRRSPPIRATSSCSCAGAADIRRVGVLLARSVPDRCRRPPAVRGADRSPNRTGHWRRRRPAVAEWCSPPTSPRPASPWTACRIVVDSGQVRTPTLRHRGAGSAGCAPGPSSRASADQRSRARRADGTRGGVPPVVPGRARRGDERSRRPRSRRSTSPGWRSSWPCGARRRRRPDVPRRPTDRRPTPAARSLLTELGALDADRAHHPGRTVDVRAARPSAARPHDDRRSFRPRLGGLACALAALLEERDVFRGRPDELPADLADRVRLVVVPTDRRRRFRRTDRPFRRATSFGAGPGELRRRRGRGPTRRRRRCRRLRCRCSRSPTRTAWPRHAATVGSGCATAPADSFPSATRSRARRSSSSPTRCGGCRRRRPDPSWLRRIDEVRRGSRGRAVHRGRRDADVGPGRDDLRRTSNDGSGSIVLSTSSGPARPGDDTSAALVEHVASTGLGALRWTDRARSLQRRGTVRPPGRAGRLARPVRRRAARRPRRLAGAPCSSGRPGRKRSRADRRRAHPARHRRATTGSSELDRLVPAGRDRGERADRVPVDYSGEQPVDRRAGPGPVRHHGPPDGRGRAGAARRPPALPRRTTGPGHLRPARASGPGRGPRCARTWPGATPSTHGRRIRRPRCPDRRTAVVRRRSGPVRGPRWPPGQGRAPRHRRDPAGGRPRGTGRRPNPERW